MDRTGRARSVFETWVAQRLQQDPEGVRGVEADLVTYDEAWPSQRAALEYGCATAEEEARGRAYNERCLPDRRICLRAGGCIGDGVQVNWCDPAGAWLCLDCLENFSGRQVGF